MNVFSPIVLIFHSNLLSSVHRISKMLCLEKKANVIQGCLNKSAVSKTMENNSSCCISYISPQVLLLALDAVFLKKMEAI